MSTESEDAARHARISADIVSIAATVIAVIALATAVYQAKLMRDQAKASVWPYLIQGNSGNGGYSRIVQNVGIGPAIIRAFEVRVDGHVVHDWDEAAESLHITPSWRDVKTTTFRAGIVLPTNTTTELIDVPDTGDVKLFRIRIDHLDTWVCFCSLYGDCWTQGGTDFEPARTKRCTDNPDRRWKD